MYPPRRPKTKGTPGHAAPHPPFSESDFYSMPHPGCRDFFHSGGFADTGEALALGWDKGLSPIVGRLVLKRVTKVSAGFVTEGFVTGMSWSSRSHSAMTSGFRGMARRTRSMVRRAVLRSAGRLPPCDRTAHPNIPAGTASPHSGHTFGHHEHRQQWGAGGQQ
jgi:hypothetical protein